MKTISGNKATISDQTAVTAAATLVFIAAAGSRSSSFGLPLWRTKEEGRLAEIAAAFVSLKIVL